MPCKRHSQSITKSNKCFFSIGSAEDGLKNCSWTIIIHICAEVCKSLIAAVIILLQIKISNCYTQEIVVIAPFLGGLGRLLWCACLSGMRWWRGEITCLKLFSRARQPKQQFPASLKS